MADVDGQAKIWLVVKPEVGLMWLLGLVTLIAVLVHCLLVGQTKWFPPTGKVARLKWRSNTSFRTPSKPYRILKSPQKEIGNDLLRRLQSYTYVQV